jgi:signal peptide peptidase SppA
VGICLGFIPPLLLFAGLLGKAESEPTSKYTMEIVSNAQGVRKKMSSDAPVILSLQVHGVIGLNDLTQENVRQLLIESREGSLKDDRVKAILLNIQSPGGTVIDADGIYHAIKSYKETHKTPVYAYVDGLCASGGMYVAAAADKIYASDSSLIGSVGVISPSFLNLSQTIEKIGVKALTLSAGKGKDDLDPLRPWRPGEQDSMQGIINSYYKDFVDILTTNRPELNKQKLVEVYGANIFLAPQAKEYGYVDGNGYTRNQTLQLLLKEIGIEDDYYQVVELSSNNWFSSLFNSQSALFTGRILHDIKWPTEYDSALMGKFLYLYR